MSLWLTILLAGLLTFGTRLSFILLLERIKVPGWFKRSLRFVPVAVLSALILPGLATRGSHLDLTLQNPQLYAGALAVLVAWRTRNILFTILAGMVTLFIVQWLLGIL